MPELPEVETIVRGLRPVVRGRRIRHVSVVRPNLLDGESPEAFADALRGRKILEVRRRAKNIVFRLDRGRLVVNLGMTGRLLVGSAEPGSPPHLGVLFHLSGGDELLYQDVRRFGRLRHMSDRVWREWNKRLGLEPLSRGFSAERLFDLSRHSRVAIKTWLMDQRRVVGIGNIYASEALFRAGVDPRRPAHTLTYGETQRLRNAVREVLKAAIRGRGTTLSDYRDARGDRGTFSAKLKVYGRAEAPCPRCGTPIERLVQGGRSTFFCPECQSERVERVGSAVF